MVERFVARRRQILRELEEAKAGSRPNSVPASTPFPPCPRPKRSGNGRDTKGQFPNVFKRSN